MTQDLGGTLKILAVLLLCSGAAGLVASFLEGKQTGRRAFCVFIALGSVVAALQVFEAWYAPAILALAIAGGYAGYRNRQRRKRNSNQ